MWGGQQTESMFHDLRAEDPISMSEQERQQHFQQIQIRIEAIRQSVHAKLQAKLMPEQWARLQQIARQREGVHAWLQTDLSQKFGLDAKQRETLRQLFTDGPPPFAPPAEHEAFLFHCTR